MFDVVVVAVAVAVVVAVAVAVVVVVVVVVVVSIHVCPIFSRFKMNLYHVAILNCFDPAPSCFVCVCLCARGSLLLKTCLPHYQSISGTMPCVKMLEALRICIVPEP